MADFPIFIFTALLILGFGLFSRLAERSVISAPMVFVVVGILLSNFNVAALKEGINAPLVRVLAELTLVMVLFVDASTISLRDLLRERKLPLRLLLVGLPLTMLLGIAIAIPLFPGADIWMLALMALILSPTDAALGQAVVTSNFVPERIRQTINVESGLNDGIALPPILICIAALTGLPSGESGTAYWSMFTLKQFIFGPLIGGGVGIIGGILVDWSSRKGWMNKTFQRLASVAIAILAFALAEEVHGNGFIAAYFAGLLLSISTPSIRERIHEFGEAESQALELFIFLLFGMILVPFALPYWDIRAWLYALLSLTVIRMVPVALSLTGLKLSWGDIAFIGWFGPRGIASVLYLVMAFTSLGMNGSERYFSVIILTILLSIFMHGISANPLSKRYHDNTP